MILNGVCTVFTTFHEQKAWIEVDLHAGSVSILLPFARKNNKTFMDLYMLFYEHLGRSVTVTDVELYSARARFIAPKLGKAFISGLSSNTAVHSNKSDRYLCAATDNSGIKLKVTLTTQRLDFNIQSLAEGLLPVASETVFSSGTRISIPRANLTLFGRGRVIRVSDGKVSVTPALTILQKDIFKHVLSLAFLEATSELYHLRRGKLLINLSPRHCKGYGKSIFEEKDCLRFITEVSELLVGTTEALRFKRINEIKLLSSGFDQKLLLEDRTMNLFRCFESFDGCRTLSAKHLAKLLKFENVEADFIVQVRNKLIHEALPLSVAMQEAAHKINCKPAADKKAHRFKNLGRLGERPFRFYVTLSRRIVDAYLEELQIGIPLQRLFDNQKSY